MRHIAVIGSGPAGYYTAEACQKQFGDAVRIDDGALLDAADQLERARAHLSPATRAQAASLLGCEPDKLDRELASLVSRARTRAIKLQVDADMRDRAANGRYAWTFDRGRHFARGIWVVDPLFMLDVVRERVEGDEGETPAREESSPRARC